MLILETLVVRAQQMTSPQKKDEKKVYLQVRNASSTAPKHFQRQIGFF